MRPGITFDTGALVALSRRDQRIRRVIQDARDHDVKITVPAVAVLEWWRGGYRQQHDLERLVVEQLTERIAKIAGNVMAKLHDANPIDAAVMASAASRGDVVYTSDMDDLTILQTYFPAVRLFRATGAAIKK